jgi:putative ABC transport system permease protein
MIILTQAAMSLAVPLLAALGPILAGTRITVRAALDDQGIAQPGGPQRHSWLAGGGLRFVPRPLLLALRNTFRRRGRLALTLITLTLGGAIFVAVFSVRTSLLGTLDELTTRLYNFDAEIYLERTYRADYLVSEAERLPGVVAAEAQIQTSVRRVFPDDAEGLQLQMFAVPPDTQTMLPRMQAGRWLRPEDENALVISTGMQAENPDLQVGSTLTLKIDGRETTWQVVGIMPTFAELRWVYAGYDYYSRVAREVDQSSYIRIVADQHSPAYQAALVNAVEGHFKRQGINVSSTKTMTELSQGDREIIQVLVVSLLFMAFLVALVGGLGLAGTMSLNVIERTREIGIMRAIGASNGAIMQIVLAEGLLIGLLSWGLGTLLALPVSRLLSDGLGELLFADPLAFHFSLTGGLIWLLLSVALALGASLLPARNATRVSVRDVLAYE